MFINTIMIIILIMAIIFFLGFVGHLIYLLITPSNKLSTEDFSKKNILFKYLKIKNLNIIFDNAFKNKNTWYVYLLPGIDISYDDFTIIKIYYLDFNWLFWSISFQYKIKDYKL